MMKVSLVHSPETFFRDLVRSVLGKQKRGARPEVELYLAQLLNHFVLTENLFPEKDGKLEDLPLAEKLKRAIEQENTETQIELFKQLGDVTLYTAGFFQDSLSRKTVDIQYYIDMGEAAYQQVALRQAKGVELFEELAKGFPSYVEVLAEVSDQTTPRTEKNLLRMYDVWLQTGSERVARLLKEAGIVPNSTLSKKFQ